MLDKLSVCIVAYNNYTDIKSLIISMEKYTSPSLEKKIYVVDNGVSISNKADIEDFKEFLKKYKKIEYIDAGGNIGFGSGHNTVIDYINSEYHAIVNPDIIFCEDTFSKVITWMDEHKDVGMTIPLIVDEKGQRQEVYRNELTVFDMFNRMVLKSAFHKRAQKHTMQYMDFSKSFNVPFGQGSFLIVRTDLFKSLNGFDNNFFMYVEDADLCKRVNQISKLVYYPETKVIHKWEKGSHKNRVLLKYHIQSMKYYFKKWGWKFI